jgi:hypothetical protein
MAKKKDPLAADRKPTVKAPVPKQWKKGPIYALHRPGWHGYSWSPHGFSYSIRFDANGDAEIYGPHYDVWIGDTNAANHGITTKKGN